jgi:hypothetical protein
MTATTTATATAKEKLYGVLETRELNRYDDSDFYAIVWDGEKFRRVVYASTSWAGELYELVPATPEEREQALAEYARRIREDLLDAIARDARKPELGKRVTVSAPRARNRPRTGEGQVFWTGCVYNRFTREREERVGVVFDDGARAFYAESEVVCIDPENWVDADALAAVDYQVSRAVQNPRWVLMIDNSRSIA